MRPREEAEAADGAVTRPHFGSPWPAERDAEPWAGKRCAACGDAHMPCAGLHCAGPWAKEPAPTDGVVGAVSETRHAKQYET